MIAKISIISWQLGEHFPIENILAKIILRHIEEHLKGLIDKEQAGVCSGYSWSVQEDINTLRITVKQLRNTALQLTFCLHDKISEGFQATINFA